ncbi:MAG: OmpA family protein [Acidimicrobiia bacterium]|nr:OmpA family protein [Acidimicrobiia bacterium]
MEHDPERDAVHAAITTAEHRNLGNVLDAVRRLEELRARGLSSAQIAARIRLTHPNRPGGGQWSPEAVERVLEIADASRTPTSPRPAGQQVTQPIPTTHSTSASDPRSPDPGRTMEHPSNAYPPPRPRPTTELPPVADPRLGGPPPGESHGYRSPSAYVAVGGHRVNDQPAPLRVEPRRYHQRPTVGPQTLLQPEKGRRWPAIAGLLTLIGLVAVGVGLYRVGVFDRFTTIDDQAGPATPDATDSTAAGDQDADGAESEANPGGADSADAPSDGSDGSAADRLVIRIEPSPPETADGIVPASATIRNDGKLYIEGAFRSESEAQRFLESAAEVFGEDALVSGYTINPAAPDPTVSDVVLEKPVLFESGSAVIDPQYIPFLEACGDVLKLNPHIVMSVSAFTDASGSADLNLELSQQRADAVIDFYRSLDIGDDQLISTGFGESDFVADNNTEEGRRQNRRAMLELLNVMKDG